MKIEHQLVLNDKKSSLIESADHSYNSYTNRKRENSYEGEGFGYVLEEISEVQTSLVNFYTILFEIGILLIPIQIIVYEDIKPYEISIILYLQNVFNLSASKNISTYLFKLVLSSGSINFLTSFNVFIHFFTDTLVSMKVCFLLGTCSYIVYALKLIIHDSRPFWINPEIIGLRCKTSFGCPTLDVFAGIFYFNFLVFNIQKRQTFRNLSNNFKFLLKITKYISVAFILIILLVGFIHVLIGENFIYQVISSIFYVFLILRVVITFDELIDYYAKYARLRETTSRRVSINLFFTVILLSIISLVLYSITSYDLTIPLTWSENIARNCPRDLVSDEISTKNTLLESCSIFQVMGAAFGLNIVLKYIKNKDWEQSDIPMRIVKGLVGFMLNFIIIYSKNLFICKSLATEYIMSSVIFFLSGIFSYGFLPIIFNYFKMNNEEEKSDELQLRIS